MKWITKGSSWLSIFEHLVYVCPTLGVTLYYYFSQIRETVSYSSKFSFGMALVLFVLFMIYKRVIRNKVDDLRKAVVQTETDLRNGVGDPEKCAANLKKDHMKLDAIQRAEILIILFVIALAIYIMEQAAIGLTNLVLIAVGSVVAGSGIHIGVLKLKEQENINENKKDDKD